MLLDTFVSDDELTSSSVLQFLEGLFQNIAHAKDFFKLDPLSLLLDLLTSPAIPSNCTGTSAFNSITSLFRIMSDVKAAEVVKFILKQISKSLKETEPLWDSNFGESKLSAMLDFSKFKFIHVLLVSLPILKKKLFRSR